MPRCLNKAADNANAHAPAPTAPGASPGSQLLSERVLSMKFMKRGEEAAHRQKLSTLQFNEDCNVSQSPLSRQPACVAVGSAADPDLLFRPGRRAFGGCNPTIDAYNKELAAKRAEEEARRRAPLPSPNPDSMKDKRRRGPDGETDVADSDLLAYLGQATTKRSNSSQRQSVSQSIPQSIPPKYDLERPFKVRKKS